MTHAWRCRIPHNTDLIATLSVALVLAFVAGLVANRLRLPAIVGYLLAGILVGPFTPGFEASSELAPQLAEIGVILLMFGVGIHFSLRDLLEVRGIAVPGAVVQSTIATLLAIAITHLWGWDIRTGLVVGLALSVASTVVLLRALLDQDLLTTIQGRVAVGWLVVEDLFTVLALVLLPMLADTGAASGGSDGIFITLLVTLAKVAVLIAAVLVIGSRVVPWLLVQVARTGSRELFTLAVLAIAFGVAFGSATAFGVSMALGAFLAGLIMGESDLSHRAAQEALPMRDAFAVLFFISVGMLFDPAFVLEYPLELLAVLLIVLVAKPLAAFGVVMILRQPPRTGLVVAAGLAQVGEFSFILAELGDSLDLLPREGHSLILAAAIVSITLNPLMFRMIEPVEAWLRRRSSGPPPVPAAVTEPSHEEALGRVLLCGYGRVGRIVAEGLEREGVPYTVVEQDRGRVEDIRRRQIPAIHGDIAEPALLSRLPLDTARLLILAIPDPIAVRLVAEAARKRRPDLPIIARTHSQEEWTYLSEGRVDVAVLGEHELARTMARLALAQLGVASTIPAPFTGA